jgi:hypothetical protein
MCNCAAIADAKLASMNTHIDWAQLISPDGKLSRRLKIATAKSDKRKRQGASILVCTFCPFCGEKLPEA